MLWFWREIQIGGQKVGRTLYTHIIALILRFTSDTGSKGQEEADDDRVEEAKYRTQEKGCYYNIIN